MSIFNKNNNKEIITDNRILYNNKYSEFVINKNIKLNKKKCFWRIYYFNILQIYNSLPEFILSSNITQLDENVLDNNNQLFDVFIKEIISNNSIDIKLNYNRFVITNSPIQYVSNETKINLPYRFELCEIDEETNTIKPVIINNINTKINEKYKCILSKEYINNLYYNQIFNIEDITVELNKTCNIYIDNYYKLYTYIKDTLNKPRIDKYNSLLQLNKNLNKIIKTDYNKINDYIINLLNYLQIEGIIFNHISINY